MDGPVRVQSCQKNPRGAVKKQNLGESSLSPMTPFLQSQKPLCAVSAEDSAKEDENVNEVTFLCFANDSAVAAKELATVSVGLPDVLKSAQWCSLHDQEALLLKDVCKPAETSHDFRQKRNCASRVLCVMRLSPSIPRLRAETVVALLSKYTAAIRCTEERHALPKPAPDSAHTENDDTNQSVSSIEDDFVTALEHLDEEDPAKAVHTEPEKSPESPPKTSFAHHLKSNDQKSFISSLYRRPSVKSSISLVNILELEELSSSIRNPVSASLSDPWIQRGFFRSHGSSDRSVNFLHKTLFSSSPADSSESDCSSPSPVIFLDEEGYQKSLKAKLQLPKIPVGKDGVEDSDSEVSEFFDSFDQFDECEQTLEDGPKSSRDPTAASHISQKSIVSWKKPCSTTSMNPQKFKCDRPVLPANVKKPTPRKLEYNNLLDVPDSPRLIKNPADDHTALFSPIRSSAFSPLGTCFPTECLCQINRDSFSQNHNIVYHTYSDFANNISFEILGSVCNARPPSLCRCTQEMISQGRIVPEEEKDWTAKTQREISRKGLHKKDKSKHKSGVIKDHIQKFASELVETSFGSAFKDLQKGVSSCTNALCQLAAKLTSSVFQMAFYEIGRQQALLLKKKALNGLAGFLVSQAVTGALKELYSVKQQMFTNTVTKFAANLAEELIFEGIMEVCQFSHPATPTASHQGSFQYDNTVVWSYAKDLSESVIQDAFIELSQVDVSFTPQAAISVSVDNVQYVSTERVVELTQTSSGSSELCEKAPVALNPAWEFRKEHTISRALFYTSGIASSIPAPLAGSILSQHQILWNEAKVKNQSASGSTLSFYKGPTEMCCAPRKNQSEVSSLRNVYLTNGFTPEKECKPPDQSEANKFAEISSINNFSGTMVDMIVSEAYEAVTSSRVSKSAEQYTGMLQMKNASYLQCIGKDSCKNMFANYLTKRIIKQSVDETKSTCSATGEKLAYCVGLGTNARSRKKESQSVGKQGDNTKNIPVIVGQQQMPINNISKFHISTASPNRCLLLGCKDGVQEKKKQAACKPSPSTLSPVVSFVKPNEQVPDVEDGSAIPISTLLEKQSVSKATGGSVFGCGMSFSEINNCSVVPKCEDALRLEDKLSVGERNLLVVTETPPSTPLVPSQASSEWSLRTLTKKLKGELAKEFAPATPPSTPYVPETDGIYTPECENLEKEEFMLKLMRSLSEEVENKKVEEQSATLIEQIQPLGPTIDYADHLATCIISMATEQASSRLQDKATLKNGCFQVGTEDKRWGYSTLINLPEKHTHSLWIYAGEMAGRVIREAKKRVNSRQCKLLRLSQVNYEGDCFHLKRSYHECWSKDKRQKSRGRELDSSVLPVPLNSEALGLNSKYPSCESVTDEYTDHIIRILKQEGGHGDLIMDNFASRLAYKSVRSGIQQAARKLRVKYSRKVAPEKNSRLNGKLELFGAANQDVDLKNQKNGTMLHLAKQPCRSKCPLHGAESSKLLDFSESLACRITSDARRTFTSMTSLPKSLTDSCLYQPSRDDKVTDFKATWTERLPSSRCKQKLYHSTESLRDSTYQENVLQALDQYAKKIVDDTLEVSLESATGQAPEGWTNGERLTWDKKMTPFSIAACKHCTLKERHSCTGGSSVQLAGHELPSTVRYASDGSVNITLPKSHVLHLDIPQIHVNMDEKVIFAENLAPVNLGRARRQLSNTSLTADSGISQDGISFAESLTTEIMTSCMTNIAPAINISAMETEGVNSAESMVSQHPGDDSTGSWSNLSFDEEHPDESSSFLHLSDSNGNSSSWSSLGLEGDLSLPTSDSDGTEEKAEELKDSTEEVRKPPQALVVVNVDVGPCTVDPQLRMTLQWLSASEAGVAELRFHDDTAGEFVLLSKTLQEKGWRVGDLFEAVLKYCEAMEKSADGDRALERKTLFVWLRECV